MSKLSFALPLALLLASAVPGAAQAPAPVSPDLMIAFLGDQGLGTNAEAVLALVRDEGADAVIHMGDFDYEDDPAAWNAQIDAFLGPDFPYFASAGNHDKGKYYGPGGYQELLEARMSRLGIPWEGDLGVQSTLRFEGIFVVLTAPGSYGDGDSVHAPYIRDALAADDSVWSISAWHKNMRRMQVGGKSDETGWGVYEESRRGGAIIATAHEHSYSRTHLLSDFENQVVASSEEHLVLAADDPATAEDEGRSFAFVSGLGGHSIRDQEIDGPWWASVYTSDQGAHPGALFGIFNYGGDPNLARFYFKDVAGQVVDDFLVASSLVQAQPSLRIGDVAVVEGDSGSSDAILGVTLLAASGDEVAVDYATTDGDATAGADYSSTSGSLVFSGELTEQSVRVPIWGDEDAEGDESLFVDLVATGGAIVTRPRGEVIILDDDAPPLLLEVGTQGLGVVTLDPPGGLYPPATRVSLTAIPAPGHAFAGWDGDLGGVANPATLLLDGDRRVTARFVALEPSLEQVETGAAESEGSVSTAAPLAAADGHLYVAAIASKPEVDVAGVSGLGLAWSPVRAQCAGRGQTGIAVWQARGEPAGDGVVAATFSRVPQSSVVAVARYSGVGAIDPLRAVSANTVGVAGDCSGGSDGDAYAVDLDTAGANSIVLVAAAPRGRDHLPGPGFVERAKLATGGAGGAAGISVADSRGDLPGTVAVAGGFSGSVDWAVVALEIPLARPFFLTVKPSPGGSIVLDPPGGFYAEGSAVALTAVPNPRHRFTGWAGDLSGLANPAKLLVDANRTVTARFVSLFELIVTSGPGGSVEVDPPGGLYEDGSSITLTAVPDANHLFGGWSGLLAGMGNPAVLEIEADETVAASFVPRQLEVQVIAAAGGSVALDPPGGIYEYGTSVTLTAMPTGDAIFAGWERDLVGEANPVSVVVDRDLEVSARFRVPVALEEIATGASSNASRVSTEGALIGAEGDLYLAAIAFKPHVSVSDVSGLGLAWSPVGTQCAGRGQTGLALWQASGQPSGDGIVTASLSPAPQNAVIAVSRYASAALLDPAVALSANSLGVAGACEGGEDQDAYALELDATTAGGFLYVATAMRHRDHLPGSGFEERIELYQGGAGSAAGLSVADHRIGESGPTAVHGSFDSVVDWALVAAEVHPVPEPDRVALLASGIALLLALRHRRGR